MLEQAPGGLMTKEFSASGDGLFYATLLVAFRYPIQRRVIEDRVSFLEAAFIEPVSCVVHSAKAMGATIGSSVAVIGCGLGILHGALARLRGCAPVIVIGRNPKKLAIAREMGADVVLNIKEHQDPVAEVKKLTEGRGADYVVEAVGTPQTYEQAFQMVRPGGTVVAFGICAGEDTIQVRPFDLVLGEKNVVSSCAGVGPDWPDAIALLAYGHIKPQPLFSMIVPVEELEAALRELRTNPNLFKVFVSSDVSKREILSK